MSVMMNFLKFKFTSEGLQRHRRVTDRSYTERYQTRLSFFRSYQTSIAIFVVHMYELPRTNNECGLFSVDRQGIVGYF